MRWHLPCFGFLTICLLSPVAHSADVRVADRQQLLEALRAATGGDHIVLAPGHYGKLELAIKRDAWASYTSPVTIESESATDLAVFATVSLAGVENLHFNRVKFDYVFATGDVSHLNGVAIQNCIGITIFNSIFDGDNASGTGTPADGFGTGRGLMVDGSSQIRIEGNRIYGWLRGGVFSETAGLAVVGNELSGLRSDGLDFASVQDVLIQANRIGEFRTSLDTGDHPDMIQFWTSETTKPSVNVTIRSNVLDQGGGDWTQSIFMRNELVDQGVAGYEMFYRNISIDNNVIRNGHVHGITVGETDTLAITANTLIQSVSVKDGGTVTMPAINVSKNARNVRITKNVTPAINTGTFSPASHWTVSENAIVQRDTPSRIDHYRNVFVDAEVSGKAGLKSLQLLPESPPAKQSLGSSLSKFDTMPAAPGGYILHRTVSADGRTLDFDASHLYGPAGPRNADDAVYDWEFGDATHTVGQKPRHVFAGWGHFNVSVRITFKNGQMLDLGRTVVLTRE